MKPFRHNAELHLALAAIGAILVGFALAYLTQP